MEKIEYIKELVNEAREYDNNCAFPPKSLVDKLEEVYGVLPKFKREADPETYRFLKEYIHNTVYVIKGKLLKP